MLDVNPRSWRGHYFLAVFFDVTHDRLSERALTSLITNSKFVSCLYVQLQFILEIHSVQSDLFFCPYLSDQDCDQCFKCFLQAGTQRRCFLLAAKDVSFFSSKVYQLRCGRHTSLKNYLGGNWTVFSTFHIYSCMSRIFV